MAPNFQRMAIEYVSAKRSEAEWIMEDINGLESHILDRYSFERDVQISRRWAEEGRKRSHHDFSRLSRRIYKFRNYLVADSDNDDRVRVLNEIHEVIRNIIKTFPRDLSHWYTLEFGYWSWPELLEKDELLRSKFPDADQLAVLEKIRLVKEMFQKFRDAHLETILGEIIEKHLAAVKV